jgi:hypothetical protein
VNNRNNYTGPNAAGAPKDLIPDWLDHTANERKDGTTRAEAPDSDPGPGAVGATDIQQP